MCIRDSNYRYPQNLRNIQDFNGFHTCVAQGFIQDLGFWEAFAEFLDGSASVTVNGFCFATGN